jgi:hypothetical protein
LHFGWRILLTLWESFFNTIDPENVKALLATNFKDFGLGQRLDAFGPLLGEGIFTTGKVSSPSET